MQEVSLIGIIFFVLLGSGLVLSFILLLFVLVMHNILGRRLDPILFREPWFNATQLVMFASWPLSFIKSINYMFLIGYPNITLKVSRFTNTNRFTKRLSSRFNGLHLKDVPPVQPSLKIACKIYTILHLLTAIIGVSMFLFIGGVYVFDNWLN